MTHGHARIFHRTERCGTATPPDTRCSPEISRNSAPQPEQSRPCKSTCRDREGASEERIQARVEKAKGSRARRFAAGWAWHPRGMGAQAGAGQLKKGGRDPPHFSRLFEMNWSTTAPQRARGSLAGILSAFNGGSPWLETVCTCGVVPVNTPPRKEVDFLAIEDLGWVVCVQGMPLYVQCRGPWSRDLMHEINISETEIYPVQKLYCETQLSAKIYLYPFLETVKSCDSCENQPITSPWALPRYFIKGKCLKAEKAKLVGWLLVGWLVGWCKVCRGWLVG